MSRSQQDVEVSSAGNPDLHPLTRSSFCASVAATQRGSSVVLCMTCGYNSHKWFGATQMCSVQVKCRHGL